MIYFEVKDNNGKILAGNMQGFSKRSKFENNKNFSENKNGKGLKGVYENLENITLWVVVEDDQDLLKSSKLFKKTLALYKTIILDIYKHYKNDINAYAHILNTIQAQMWQQIDNFADSREFFGETYKDSVKRISDILDQNKESAADLICYIQKRVIDMRAHLLGAEIIHSGEEYEVKPVIVSLKRAILNQYTPFLEEFEKNMIEVKFFFGDECEIEVDKNMFSLIMYNFFSNAIKYARPNSEVRFNYSDDLKSLDVSMISLRMERNELADLSKDGIRGQHAKNIPGKGIGLFVIQRALELMKKDKMYISPNYEKIFHDDDSIYNENHFQFKL
jgi:signal transduction histidine kinase